MSPFLASYHVLLESAKYIPLHSGGLVLTPASLSRRRPVFERVRTLYSLIGSLEKSTSRRFRTTTSLRGAADHPFGT